MTVGTVAAVVSLFGAHLSGLSADDNADVRTFHVSPDGDDRDDGRSPGSAWRSLERADAERLRPGDRILLKGGSRLSGSISLGPGEAGDAARPVVLGSYGDGRAVLEADGDTAVTVYNTAGVQVRDLVLTGDEATYADVSGVKIYNDLPGDRRLDGVTVTGVEVTGFKAGVEVGAAEGSAGFRDVTVRDSRLHHNMEVGLLFHGTRFDGVAPRYSHEAVTVTAVEAFNNPGDPENRERNTGSGIVLGSVRGGLIEGSSAHDNGSAAAAPEGPVGIWAFDSTEVVMQHNVAYSNRTAGRQDGGGFDLDENVSSSVLQYNLSYDNDGAGYLFYSGENNGAHRGNTIRYNVSSDDGRKLSTYGSIMLSGYVRDAEVYHNTVIASASGAVRAPAVRVKGMHTGVALRNNLFVSTDTGLVASRAYRPSEVVFQGNVYFARSGKWAIGWGDKVHSTLGSWRAATGQERVGPAVSGIAADPRLGVAGVPKLGPDSAYVPRAGSPAIGRALDLRTLFGTDPGGTDFLGQPVDGPAAVGAVQPLANG